MRFLVAESEPPTARAKRRDSVDRSSGETYADVLREMAPDADIDRVKPADHDGEVLHADAIADYDAVFLTGSPLHLYESSPENDRVIAFMRAVFASGTPSFGSCAGLQVATVAAGGTVRSMEDRRESGFARRITATAAGRDHPLLQGRAAAWDAPSIHTDEVETLPEGGTLLAGNAVTQVQAAEIRHDRGIFWGVQYHPELSLGEIAAALRRQSDDLVQHRLARSEADVEVAATLLDSLANEAGRIDIAWRLGIDDEVIDVGRRRTELRNFINVLVERVRTERGR